MTTDRNARRVGQSVLVVLAIITAAPGASVQASVQVTSSLVPMANDLILALFASLVAVGLIAAGLIWLARRRARNTVGGKIKSFRKSSVEVMDRLDSLKERLKLLPTEDLDFKVPMSGETLVFYKETQKKVGGLWDRWLEVMDALDKAQALAKENSAPGSQKLKEAEHLVSGSKMFEEIDSEAKACVSSMDRLNRAHEEARAAAEALRQQIASIRASVDHLGKDGLPTTPYQAEIDDIASRAKQVDAILTPDPIGACSQASQVRDQAALLQQRVDRIVDIHQEARTVTEALTPAREQAAKYRQDGLRLDEQGGNPDFALAQAAHLAEQLRQALNEGDHKAASEHLAAARAALDQARQTLQGVLKARDFCDIQQSERMRETQRLREAMAQYEAFETELQRDFAPTLWQNVAGNLAQARALLRTFDRKAQEAAEAASSAEQKYLLAARLLGQLIQEQQAVLRLMMALGDQLTGLRAVREDCRKLVHELADQSAASASFFERNERSIGAAARDSLAAAQESRRLAEELLDDKQPDWPRIRQLLEKAMQGQAMARSQATAMAAIGDAFAASTGQQTISPYRLGPMEKAPDIE
jgi:DNA repair exonuclease SbcCD ATPase subunit